MSEANTIESKTAKAKKMMLWFGMISITMTFAGLTSAFIISSSRPDWLDSFVLPTWFTISTISIILSSVFFQLAKIPFPVLGIMILAIINGLITSIILETVILMKQDLDFSKAFKTAMGMSFISMISMEITMNLIDYLLTGGAILTWWVVPIMLAVGFVTPWPYNYWRLKKFNEACH